MSDLILASASPRRRRLLEEYGFEFVVIPSSTHEEDFASPDPSAHVLSISKAKALDVASKAGGVVLAADTIVVLDKQIIEKPTDIDEARSFLMKLSGTTHQVYTGFFVIGHGRSEYGFEVSLVTFNNLDKDHIDDYLASGDALDKAGGYNAEDSSSSLFIKEISGSRTNVVGLPIERILPVLEGFGIRTGRKAHR